jgi:hypothetical protein
VFRWCQTETSVAQPCQSAKPGASRRSASGTSASGPRLIPHGSTGYGGKDELFIEVVKACDADWPRPWGATLGSSIFAQIEAWLGRPKGRCASAHAHRPDRRHAFALHHMDEVAPPEPPLGVLLFQSRRHAFGDHPPGFEVSKGLARIDFKVCDLS